VVDLTQPYGPQEDVTAYAWAQIETDAETDAVLALGSECGVQVWLNGELIHDSWDLRGVTVDEDVVGVQLRPGSNSLLMKVGAADGGWGFVARFLGPGSASSAMLRAKDGGAFRALSAIGADVDATDDDGRTRLYHASHRGETDVVLALLDLGASVGGAGPRGFTPLHEAASWGHREIVSALLSHGAAVDALAFADLTPLHLRGVGPGARMWRNSSSREEPTRVGWRVQSVNRSMPSSHMTWASTRRAPPCLSPKVTRRCSRRRTGWRI
jgi:hypothetical protein